MHAKGPLVRELSVGDKFIGVYVCSDLVKKESSRGEYLILKLKDKTGEIDARLWDIKKGLLEPAAEKGQLMIVDAEVGEYNGKPQVSVKYCKKVQLEEVDQQDAFVRISETPLDLLWEDVMQAIGTVKSEPLKFAVQDLYESNKEKVLRCPAAKANHHAWVGGLMEHMLSMYKVVDFLWSHYGGDRDVLVAATFLHDIGKIEELRVGLDIEYTCPGTVLGHIPIGILIQDKFFSKYSVETRVDLHVKHLILSHHGRKEYGSPVVPATFEAILFHFVDMIDSRAQIYDDFMSTADCSQEGLTPWNRQLETYLWKP